MPDEKEIIGCKLCGQRFAIRAERRDIKLAQDIALKLVKLAKHLMDAHPRELGALIFEQFQGVEQEAPQPDASEQPVVDLEAN